MTVHVKQDFGRGRNLPITVAYYLEVLKGRIHIRIRPEYCDPED